MATFGDAAAHPPEVNYYTLIAGDHAASATAAAAGHQVLAQMLAAEIAAMGANTAATATAGWHGAGGTAMTMSATEFMAVMSLAVAWFEEASVSAGEIVSAYHLAETSMIPGPVCETNLTTTAALVASNILGQNTPAIVALVAEYQEFWIQNASVASTYQAAVSAALGVLATPPPIAPMAPNPAGALAGVAQAGAQAGVQGALQSSAQSLNQTANTAVPAAGQAAAAPAEAMSMMSAPMSMMGQLPQMFGQVPQMLGQAPQMLGQLAQLPMGMMGPLTSGMGNVGGAGAGDAGAGAAAPLGPGIAAMTAGGGGGGGIGSAGTGPVHSSFTKPVSSFAAPTAPKLPGGWSGVAEPVAAGAHPSGATGTGGLYGAPASAMGSQGAGGAERTPTRTVQLTARLAGDRGDR